MRLEILNSGHALPAKIKLAMMKTVMGLTFGTTPPDVVRLLTYRPAFFGRQFSPLLQYLLRESEVWGHGRAELFAAFVSRKNQCPY